MDWSGVVGGSSSCASARGPSGLRVWPIKKKSGWRFIYYDPTEHSSPPFRPQEKQKYMRFFLFGSLAVQMLWKTSFMFLFFPSPLLNRMVNFQSVEKILPTSLFFAQCR